MKESRWGGSFLQYPQQNYKVSVVSVQVAWVSVNEVLLKVFQFYETTERIIW